MPVEVRTHHLAILLPRVQRVRRAVKPSKAPASPYEIQQRRPLRIIQRQFPARKEQDSIESPQICLGDGTQLLCVNQVVKPGTLSNLL